MRHLWGLLAVIWLLAAVAAVYASTWPTLYESRRGQRPEIDWGIVAVVWVELAVEVLLFGVTIRGAWRATSWWRRALWIVAGVLVAAGFGASYVRDVNEEINTPARLAILTLAVGIVAGVGAAASAMVGALRRGWTGRRAPSRNRSRS